MHTVTFPLDLMTATAHSDICLCRVQPIMKKEKNLDNSTKQTKSFQLKRNKWHSVSLVEFHTQKTQGSLLICYVKYILPGNISKFHCWQWKHSMCYTLHDKVWHVQYVNVQLDIKLQKKLLFDQGSKKSCLLVRGLTWIIYSVLMELLSVIQEKNCADLVQ